MKKLFQFLCQGPRRGSILVVSLWMLTILGSFAISLGYHVRQKITLSQRLDLRNALYGIAETGIQIALVELQKPDISETWDTLRDVWSSQEEIFSKIPVGDGSATVFYEYWDESESAIKIRYGAQDEESKINLNTASAEIISRILQIQAGLDDDEAEEIAYAVIDWRDTDSLLSHPVHGAEDEYYEDAKFPYEAKDAPFQVLQEFLLVRGMNADIFQKVKEKVTVYGSGSINLNTASREVLLATGLGETLVQSILAYRAGEDRQLGTADDGAFIQVSEIVPLLTKVSGGLHGGEIAVLNNLVSQGVFATASSAFLVQSRGVLPDGNALDIRAIVDRNTKILSWSAGAPYRLAKKSIKEGGIPGAITE